MVARPKRNTAKLIEAETRFGAFLRANKKRMSACALGRDADVSRQHIHRLRYALMAPTLDVMQRLRAAASRQLKRRVRMRELFDLGGGE